MRKQTDYLYSYELLVKVGLVPEYYLAIKKRVTTTWISLKPMKLSENQIKKEYILFAFMYVKF